MTISLAILWIVLISLFCLIGAYYARKHNHPNALTAFYVTLVVFAGIAASKTISIDLGFKEFYAPGAVLIFSVTFLLTDIVNEKFGREETKRMIFIALIAQIALILFSYIVVSATPAPFFTNQTAFEIVLGQVPRVVIAGLIAFYISENADAYLFDWFKKLTGGNHLWMRNAFSSLPAMLIDSVIFVTIAFYGVMPIGTLILGLTVTKWLVGIVDIPFMYLAHAILKKR